MTKYTMRSFRISEELDKKLSKIAKQKFLSRSKIIKLSLKKFLGGGK